MHTRSALELKEGKERAKVEMDASLRQILPFQEFSLNVHRFLTVNNSVCYQHPGVNLFIISDGFSGDKVGEKC